MNLPLRDMPASVINAISIAMQVSWKETYQMLFRHAHAFCCMQDDPKCAHALLKECGFFQEPQPSVRTGLDELTADCNENYAASLSLPERRIMGGAYSIMRSCPE